MLGAADDCWLLPAPATGSKRARSPVEKLAGLAGQPLEEEADWRCSKRYLTEVISCGFSKLSFSRTPQPGSEQPAAGAAAAGAPAGYLRTHVVGDQAAHAPALQLPGGRDALQLQPGGTADGDVDMDSPLESPPALLPQRRPPRLGLLDGRTPSGSLGDQQQLPPPPPPAAVRPPSPAPQQCPFSSYGAGAGAGSEAPWHAGGGGPCHHGGGGGSALQAAAASTVPAATSPLQGSKLLKGSDKPPHSPSDLPASSLRKVALLRSLLARTEQQLHKSPSPTEQLLQAGVQQAQQHEPRQRPHLQGPDRVAGSAQLAEVQAAMAPLQGPLAAALRGGGSSGGGGSAHSRGLTDDEDAMDWGSHEGSDASSGGGGGGGGGGASQRDGAAQQQSRGGRVLLCHEQLLPMSTAELLEQRCGAAAPQDQQSGWYAAASLQHLEPTTALAQVLPQVACSAFTSCTAPAWPSWPGPQPPLQQQQQQMTQQQAQQQAQQQQQQQQQQQPPPPDGGPEQLPPSLPPPWRGGGKQSSSPELSRERLEALRAKALASTAKLAPELEPEDLHSLQLSLRRGSSDSPHAAGVPSLHGPGGLRRHSSPQ